MPAIPSGSRVLVTGANGYVGSHVVDQLLRAGYSATGTVRSLERASWLEPFFSSRYGKGRFQVVQIPDLGANNALDRALPGCSGVIHVASDVSLNPNADQVIPSVVGSVQNILKASKATSSIKRFIMTSSTGAAVCTIPNVKATVGQDSWNALSVQKAYAADTNPFERGVHVYAASKVKGEQALWEWTKENKPEFDAVTVLPNFVTGKILGRKFGQDGSTGGAVMALAEGKQDIRGFPIMMFLQTLPPQHFVDVVDVARLHVAALQEEDAANERIFATAQPIKPNTILSTLRKLCPEQTLPGDVQDIGADLNDFTGKARANQLLEKYFGSSFLTLEQSLCSALEKDEQTVSGQPLSMPEVPREVVTAAA